MFPEVSFLLEERELVREVVWIRYLFPVTLTSGTNDWVNTSPRSETAAHVLMTNLPTGRINRAAATEWTCQPSSCMALAISLGGGACLGVLGSEHGLF